MQRTLVFLLFGILTYGLWGLHAWDRGMIYQTSFLLTSLRKPGLGGFLYRADTLRELSAVFYHLPYLLSRLFGRETDNFFFELVYALLLWGRTVLVYLILLRLTRGNRVFALLAAAFTLLNVSDSAVNFTKQIAQPAYLFWLAAAVFFVTWGLDVRDHTRFFLLIFLGWTSLIGSVFTYGAQLPIVILLPFLLFFRYREYPRSRTIPVLATWYSAVVLYAVLAIKRHGSGVSGYEATILRPDISWGSIFSDLWTHIVWSLSFWKWGSGSAATLSAAELFWITILSLSSGCLLFWLVWNARKSDSTPAAAIPYPVFAAAGAILLVASFPAYLFLLRNTGMWRTQFLSCFGTGLLFASGLLLITGKLKRPNLQLLVVVLAFGVFTHMAFVSSSRYGKQYRDGWLKHRALMGQIFTEIKDISDPAMILITGIPKSAAENGGEHPPFDAGYQFDWAIQISYFPKYVVGQFFFSDWQQPNDRVWNFAKDAITPVTGVIGRPVKPSQVVVFRYTQGKLKMLTNEFELPERLRAALGGQYLKDIKIIRTGSNPRIRFAYRFPDY